VGQSFALPSQPVFDHYFAMKPKTEEFLYFLLWSGDRLANPTFRNLTDSYESWAYRNGLLRQIGSLEKQQLVERDPTAPDDRIYRLTRPGRLHALGGRDPQAQWARTWDGRWRLVLFDIPTAQDGFRQQLRRRLAEAGCGCLQGSVWVTPDSMEHDRQRLAGAKINVKSLILVEGRPCSGESDAQIVAGAWDFERINRRYQHVLKILRERPAGSLSSETEARALRNWAAAEREAWGRAVRSDPLLPERILPPGYLGKEAWRQRIDALREAGRQLRTFQWSKPAPKLCPR
jgi:phenylacetic acid degradation operon negative regulatory protein